MSYDKIPLEMRQRPQWVIWRKETRDDKPTKVPYCPTRSSDMAKTNDPATWGTFAQAAGASITEHADGIGFVFTADDPYTGIDLDHCINPETGEIYRWADEITERLYSYSEKSPSGEGVHIIVKAALPDGRGRKTPTGAEHAIEAYDRLRYFCMTGKVLGGVPNAIEARQSEIDKLLDSEFKKTSQVAQSGLSVPNTSIQERARRYISKVEPSVSGNRGHDRAYYAAMVLIQGFALSIDQARPIMVEFSNACTPPWSDREIDHKLRQAEKNAEPARRGELLRNGNGKAEATQIPLNPLESDSTRFVVPPAPQQISAGDELKAHFNLIFSGKWAAVDWPPYPLLSELTMALLPETQTLICGDAGASKSLFIRQVLPYWLERGIKFADFELEESREFHIKRSLAQLANNRHLTNPDWIKANPVIADAEREKYHCITAPITECTTAAPNEIVTQARLLDWVKDNAKAGARLIIIDPITCAALEREQHIADQRFILDARAIVRHYGASLIIVTHPKAGQGKLAPSLDTMAGGQAWPRFSQTVLWMTKTDQSQELKCRTRSGTFPFSVNRTMRITKARNAEGTGMEIGYEFEKDSLRFQELGVIVAQKKPRRGA